MKHFVAITLVCTFMFGWAAPSAQAQTVDEQRAVLLAQIQVLLERLVALQEQAAAQSGVITVQSVDTAQEELLSDVVLVYPEIETDVEFIQIDTGNRTGFDAQSWYGHTGEKLVVNFDLGSAEVVEAFESMLGMIQLAKLFQSEDSERQIDIRQESPIGEYEITRMILKDGTQKMNSFIAVRKMEYEGDEYGLVFRVSSGEMGESAVKEMRDLGTNVDGLYFADENSALEFLNTMLQQTNITPQVVAQHITTTDQNLLDLFSEYSGSIVDVEPSVVKDSIIMSRMDQLLKVAEDLFDDNNLSSVCRADELESEIDNLGLDCVDRYSSVVLSAELSDGSAYCIDHSGYAGRVDDVSSLATRCE